MSSAVALSEKNPRRGKRSLEIYGVRGFTHLGNSLRVKLGYLRSYLSMVFIFQGHVHRLSESGDLFYVKIVVNMIVLFIADSGVMVFTDNVNTDNNDHDRKIMMMIPKS